MTDPENPDMQKTQSTKSPEGSPQLELASILRGVAVRLEEMDKNQLASSPLQTIKAMKLTQNQYLTLIYNFAHSMLAKEKMLKVLDNGHLYFGPDSFEHQIGGTGIEGIQSDTSGIASGKTFVEELDKVIEKFGYSITVENQMFFEEHKNSEKKYDTKSLLPLFLYLTSNV